MAQKVTLTVTLYFGEGSIDTQHVAGQIDAAIDFLKVSTLAYDDVVGRAKLLSYHVSPATILAGEWNT